jgi:hypothetical protein
MLRPAREICGLHLSIVPLGGGAYVDDAFRHSIRNFVLVSVRCHRHGFLKLIAVRLLTTCAIILLTCATYWLDAPSAQTRMAMIDANGNAVAAQLRWDSNF